MGDNKMTFAEAAKKNGYALINISALEKYYEIAIKKALDTGRDTSNKAVKDAFTDAEKRLYALPILREKVIDDREQIEELRENGLRGKSKGIVRYSRSTTRLTPEEIIDTLITDLEVSIAKNEYEIELLDKCLNAVREDKYFRCVEGRYIDNISDEEIAEELFCDATTVWRNRKRLVQRIAVRLYGVEAVR
jgi:hypothetical protein